MKKLFLAFTMGLLCFSLNAQNLVDALTYSNTKPFNSAMSIGTAGALGSIGADIGAISINPAGMGFYRNSEFGMSLGLLSPTVKTDYIGGMMSDNTFGATVPTFSYVYTKLLHQKGKEKKDELVSYNFSAQVSRSNNFYSKTFFQGRNYQSSILDMFLKNAEYLYDEELNDLSWLAYQNYLLNGNDTNDIWWDLPLPEQKRDLKQTGTIETRGGMFDWTFGGSFNYGNVFYGGVTVHASRLNKYIENTYREDNNDFTEGFKSMTLTQDIKTNGYGLGAKVGFIYRPVENFRIGFSFQTPEKLNITDKYFYKMSSDFSTAYTSQAGELHHEYRLPEEDNSSLSLGDDYDVNRYEFPYSVSSPERVTFSASYVTGEFGFLSLDVERVNYSSMKMKSKYDDYLDQNILIKSDLRSVVNVRAGTEILLNGDKRLRFGVAYYPSPYNKELEEVKNDYREWNLSAGFGIRKPSYGFDIGIMNSHFRDQYVPYFTGNPDFPESTVRKRNSNLSITATLSFYIDPD